MKRHLSDAETARRTREVTHRAIRRLDVLEWILLAASTGFAIGSGAVVAFLTRGLLGWSFRPTWVVASVLLFVIPGAIALGRNRTHERDLRRRLNELNRDDDG